MLMVPEFAFLLLFDDLKIKITICIVTIKVPQNEVTFSPLVILVQTWLLQTIELWEFFFLGGKAGC